MPAEPVTLAEQDRRLLDAVADRVVGLRLESAAILTLESVKPLALLGSQAMFFFQPFVAALFHWPDYRRFAELIEHRENLDTLIGMIETRAGARDRRPAAPAPPSTPAPPA